jgi:hypothetical protein
VHEARLDPRRRAEQREDLAGPRGAGAQLEPLRAGRRQADLVDVGRQRQLEVVLGGETGSRHERAEAG